MKTIVFLMDSLNRRYLHAYGNEWVRTPNMDRLAARSCVFDNHFVGSAPCMPARHDLLTGRLDFLERNWAPVQPFDCTLPAVLRKNGVFSHMVTDHYHYFHLGGENYHAVFDSWDFIRGQETDAWASDLGAPVEREHYGQFSSQYARNRQRFQSEADFPSPKTLRHAADWVEAHHGDDNWFLLVDSFDPHEPFDQPEMEYPDEYSDKLFFWPAYTGTEQATAEALEHARRRYAGLVTMSDRWLGKVLDVLDRYSLWEDTMVILTTDHGYLLGEHGFMAKNYMPCYNEVYQIPLMVSLPGMQGQSRCGMLTQNIDLMPTILDFFGISEHECWYPLHGGSLLPRIRGEREPIRESAIYGMFGRQVNICDGRYTYFRAPIRADNQPLNLYTAMPSTIGHYWDYDHLTDISQIETGQFLCYTDYPVMRIPNTVARLADDTHNFARRYEVAGENLLFDLETDPGQEHPLDDPALEREMCRKLAAAMRRHDSPVEQFIRLGLEG
ncbi:sulfatase [Clostridiaceae bacterium]|nr:sulfatase [Clostridiaceae bacterium]